MDEWVMQTALACAAPLFWILALVAMLVRGKRPPRKRMTLGWCALAFALAAHVSAAIGLSCFILADVFQGGSVFGMATEVSYWPLVGGCILVPVSGICALASGLRDERRGAAVAALGLQFIFFLAALSTML